MISDCSPHPIPASSPLDCTLGGSIVMPTSAGVRGGWGWVGLGLGLAIAWAAPVQGQPIVGAGDGTGTIVTPMDTPQGQEYQITGGTQAGHNLFHSFEQFGLGSGDIANFVGSPDLSYILGRVIGGDASVINGLIQVSQSNAHLFLMNPAGIIFGPGAQLDVNGSFTATTATAIGVGEGWFGATGDNDYALLVGSPNRFQFGAAIATGEAGLPGGTIVNTGNLRVNPGQNLALVGRTVLQSGTLTAPGGQVALVAVPGTQSQVLRYKEPGMILGLELQTPAQSGEPLPLGNLAPSQLPAYLTGGDLSHGSTLVVAGDGTVRIGGSGVPAIPGAVMVSGTVDAHNPTGLGGTVVITGSAVGLLDGAVMASGATGGGQIRVGGDYQGGGSLPTARVAYGSGGSRLVADALNRGDGGEIIVWADDSTRFYGTATARGGLQGGDGGLVETSGKIFLDVAGARVDTTAPQGATGLWLLDPSDLSITGTGNTNVTAGPNFDTTTHPATLTPTTIATALLSNNVTITTAGGTGGAGDMTLDSGEINSTSGNSLTLTARRFLGGNGRLSVSVTGNLIFNINQVNPELNAPSTSIQVAHDAVGSVGGSLTLNLGAGTFTNTALFISKNLTLQGAGQTQTFLDGGTASPILNKSSGAITIANLTLRNGSAGGILNTDSTAGLTLNNVTVSGNSNLSAGGGINNTGTITLNNSIVSGNTSQSSGGGIYNSGTLTITNSTISGNTSQGTGGGIMIGGGTLTVTHSTLSGNTAITNGGGIYNTNGTVSLTNSTVSGNTATLGGGIYGSFQSVNALTLNQATIANNRAIGSSGGGLYLTGKTVSLTLTHSLIADNVAATSFPDLFQNAINLTLNGPNLVENGNITGTGLIVNTDPRLSPLGNYGGPTQTHWLLPGSVALDAGNNSFVTLTTDQRGGSRVVGAAVDLGAVEFQGPTLTILGGNNQSTVVTRNFPTPITLKATETTFGNPLGGRVVTFSPPTTGPSASFAQPSLTLDATGQGSTTATANTIAGAFGTIVALGATTTPLNLTNLADAPRNISILGGSGQTTIVNTPFGSPLIVQVTDRYNNPVPGVTIDFDAPTQGASSQTPRITLSTDASGTASTPYAANTIAGSYRVTSSAVGTRLDTTFRLTNLADAPALVTIDDGNNQSTPINSRFRESLAVRVTDQYGNPVSGVAVNFSLQSTTGAGAVLRRPQGITNASGLATLSLTANDQPGSFQVIATASGINTPVTFNLLNRNVLNGAPGETSCPPDCNNSMARTGQSAPNLTDSETSQPVLTTATGGVIPRLDPGTFAQTETVQTTAFSNYLGIPAPDPLSVGEAQDIISDRDRQTGTTTAYITLRFVPATLTTPPRAQTPAATVLGAAGLKELDPLAPWVSQLKPGTRQPDDRLEALVITATGEPQLQRLPLATRRQIEFLAQRSQQDLDKPLGLYQRHMETLYNQVITPIESTLQERGIDNLLLSLGEGLRSVPWSALYDGKQFLIEKYSLGITPSLSLTDTTYVPLAAQPILAMGASTFTDQMSLPAVPIELETIAQQSGAASTFLNQDFTATRLRQEREAQRPAVIHLATHANFQPGDLHQSYIQLWGNERISLADISNFQWFTDPPVELLVLSACRTALGDPQSELGFGGLAVKAGVRSALASLWYVNDGATLALMTEFYRNLRNPEITTKAEALRQAQIALIRGDVQTDASVLRGGGSRSPYQIALPPETSNLTTETLAHPYSWAAFTLIGSPW